MSNTTDVEWQAPGRPVLRAVVAVVAVAALAIAAWWTGAVAPRVDVRPEMRTFHEGTRSGQATIVVRNDAAVAVRVADVTGPSPTFEVQPVGLPVEVDGGDETPVAFSFTYHCDPDMSDDRLRVTVRTWTGLHRTLQTDGFDWPDPC